MATTRTLKSPVTVEEITSSELYGILLKARGESAALDSRVVLQKLFAAEDYYERDLRIRFGRKRVFSDVWGRQNGSFEDASLTLPDDFDELDDIDEPAYDYRSDFFTDGRWGRIQLNYRPVWSISQMVFTFPGTGTVFTVPTSWIRLDRKYGNVQLVPATGEAILAVFTHFIVMRAIGSRGSLPMSIYVDYTTGFSHEELCQHHNELLEGLRLRTLLSLAGIISAVAAPGGGSSNSLGLDGLSRSRSFGGKFGPYSGKFEIAMEQEEAIRDNWKMREQGIPLAFA